MDYGRERNRITVEGDRLSNLPDDLIHKILSFIGIKQTIQTSALSSRWRFIWTSMPYLNFSGEEFPLWPKFSKFVGHVLTRRNNQIDVSCVKLSFRGKFSQTFVKRIMNYAFSHNVQQMTITCLLEKKVEFPLSLFRSPSLKHLTLIGFTIDHSIMHTSTWELPALTTLCLKHVTLCDESDDDTDKGIGIISKCANLKNLTLKYCSIMVSNPFTICHPKLSNLTLENGDWRSVVVNVNTPQLKNLTIIKSYGEHLISAPNLTSLLYKSCYFLQLSVDGLRSLEKVDLCIHDPYMKDAHKIVGLLQQLHSVKFLTLNLEVIENPLVAACLLMSHTKNIYSRDRRECST